MTRIQTDDIKGPVELAQIPLGAAELDQFFRLARWMAACGWINMGLSAVELLNFFTLHTPKNPATIVSALLKIAIASLCIQGARAFRNVAGTDGADQRELVLGFGKLRTLFLLHTIVMVVSLVVAAAVIAAALVLYLAMR